MRICVSGTGSQGKSTLINDFIKEWPQYTTPKESYRDFLKNCHSKKTTKKMPSKKKSVKATATKKVKAVRAASSNLD